MFLANQSQDWVLRYYGGSWKILLFAPAGRTSTCVICPPVTLPGDNGTGTNDWALVLEVLRSQSLFRYYGPDLSSPPRMVATLEREFAAMVGTRHALAVTSGTAALQVALGALGVGPGDEVILRQLIVVIGFLDA